MFAVCAWTKIAVSYPKAVPINVLMYVGKENCLQRPHVETVDDFPQIILKFLKQN
jgi:hypothetical protein